MSHETAAPERKHIRTIERRIAHLELRLKEREKREGTLQGSATFEAAELAALRVAHGVMRLYRDTSSEDAFPTFALLVQAALAIDPELNPDAKPELARKELVAELMDRASLLELLEQ